MIEKTIKIEEGQKIFFMSDPHYDHKNICRGTSSWGDSAKCRNFPTLDAMNDKIVGDINDTVGENDWLVCAGDWSFNGYRNIWVFRNRIKCKNIILVMGNHDEHIGRNKMIKIEGYRYQKGDRHYYEQVPAQELFESVWARLSLTVEDKSGSRTYEINHFPLTIWDKAHHGRVHLYGHVHGTYTHPNRAVDIGIDAIYDRTGTYRPMSEGDIAAYMEDRTFEKISHHDETVD